MQLKSKSHFKEVTWNVYNETGKEGFRRMIFYASKENLYPYVYKLHFWIYGIWQS